MELVFENIVRELDKKRWDCYHKKSGFLWFVVVLRGGRIMLSLERRNEIKNLLLEKKSITVAETAEYFDVSTETVRRDFEMLEKNGFLNKTYGGAVLRLSVRPRTDHQVLSTLFVDAKQRIAQKCASLLRPNECVYIDFSTTALQLCAALGEMELTVITNAQAVLNHLSRIENISLLSTGGSYDSTTGSYFGRNAARFLSCYHLDTAFVSCRALNMEKGLGDRNEDEAEIRRMAVENANRVVLLADHTKFGGVSFVHTCGFERITAIVTDQPLSKSWADFFIQKKIAVFEV